MAALPWLAQGHGGPVRTGRIGQARQQDQRSEGGQAQEEGHQQLGTSHGRSACRAGMILAIVLSTGLGKSEPRMLTRG